MAWLAGHSSHGQVSGNTGAKSRGQDTVERAESHGIVPILAGSLRPRGARDLRAPCGMDQPVFPTPSTPFKVDRWLPAQPPTAITAVAETARINPMRREYSSKEAPLSSLQRPTADFLMRCNMRQLSRNLTVRSFPVVGAKGEN